MKKYKNTGNNRKYTKINTGASGVQAILEALL